MVMSWKEVNPESHESLRLYAEDMVQRVVDSGYFLIDDDEEARRVLTKVLDKLDEELKEHLEKIKKDHHNGKTKASSQRRERPR